MQRLQPFLLPGLVAANLAVTVFVLASGRATPAPAAASDGAAPAVEGEAPKEPGADAKPAERADGLREPDYSFPGAPLPDLRTTARWLDQDPKATRQRLEDLLGRKDKRPVEQRLSAEVSLAMARYLEGDPAGALQGLEKATETIKGRIAPYQLVYEMNDALEREDAATARRRAWQLLAIGRRYEDVEPQFTPLARFAVASAYEIELRELAQKSEADRAAPKELRVRRVAREERARPAAADGSEPPIQLQVRVDPLDERAPPRYDAVTERGAALAVLRAVAARAGLPLLPVTELETYLAEVGVTVDVKDLILPELIERIAGAAGVEAEIVEGRIVVRELPQNPAALAERTKALYRRFILENPSGDLTVKSYLSLGEIDFSVGRFGQALPAYEALIDAFPKDPRVAHALLRAGLCYAGLGDYERARLKYTTLINGFAGTPEAASAELLTAGTYEAEGDLRRAMDTLRRIRDAARSRSVRLRTLVRLGSLEHGEGLHTDAIKSFEEAIAQGAEEEVLSEALFGLGRCLRETGDHDRAARELSRLVATDAASRFAPPALVENARALLASGRPLRALVPLKVLRERYPDSPEQGVGLELEGEAYERLDLRDRAIERWTDAARARPEDGYLLLRLAFALRERGRHAEARDTLERAARIPAAAAKARLEITRTLLAEGSYQAAIDQARAALAAHAPGEEPSPETRDLLGILAEAEARLGRLRAAGAMLVAGEKRAPAEAPAPEGREPR